VRGQCYCARPPATGWDASGIGEAVLRDQCYCAQPPATGWDASGIGEAILGGEVTGVAGDHDVVDLSAGAGANLDHFPDVGKMVGHLMA